MCFPRGLNTKQAGPRVLIFGLKKGGHTEFGLSEKTKELRTVCSVLCLSPQEDKPSPLLLYFTVCHHTSLSHLT